ncbi:MAG: hypothetical protein E7178_06605 [Erysipelotrichaceae bacterium]|nr:hypothetical protein [Erysipelotrichaceae bacterium]
MSQTPKALPKEFSPMRLTALILYIFAVAVDIFRFAFEVADGAFLYYELAVIIFDTVFGFALVFGLFKRNYGLIDLMLVILKVWDGTFFILNSLMKFDNGHINSLELITNDFLLAAGILSLTTFFFFCLHYYYEENKYWRWIEFTVFLTGIALLGATIVSIINCSTGGIQWFNVMEIVAMCLQTLAIYFVCHYVENYE